MTGGEVVRRRRRRRWPRSSRTARCSGRAPATVQSLQPIWYWLVLLAGVLLFFDVAVRRIAIEPGRGVGRGGERTGTSCAARRTAAVATPEFLERLKSRKAQVGESLERRADDAALRAGRRRPAAAVTTADRPSHARPAPPRPQPRPQAARHRIPDRRGFRPPVEGETQGTRGPRIVIGDHDFTTTAHAAVMQELIPGSQLAILPGTTHMQAPRRADLLLPMLAAFLN